MSADTLAYAGSVVNPIMGVPSLFGKQTSDNLNEAGDAANAAKNLEKQRAKQLADEAAARERANQKAANSGKRAGARMSFDANVGFGAGNTTPGLGKGSLFGN